MPPKAVTADGENQDTSSILILCHLMATCTEFKADTVAMTQFLGLAQAKNVPRKINTIINPVGYELRSGKIFNLNGDVTVPPATPATPTKASNKEKDKDKEAPSTPKAKTPATPRSAKKATPAKSPASKKRKLADVKKGEAENGKGKSESGEAGDDNNGKNGDNEQETNDVDVDT